MSQRKSIDGIGERFTRSLANRFSRRSLLARLGAGLALTPAFPLLPVARGAPRPSAPAAAPPPSEFTRYAQTDDDTKCDYWRYCAIDGSLCTCCGGGLHTCPPGSAPSLTSWVGTCVNPQDGKSYLIAYRDCCGKTSCGRCRCDNTDRETPIYRPSTNNEIIWCFGLENMTYHCSTAALVGAAE